MSQRTVTWLIGLAIVSACVLFGAVMQNLLLGLFIGILLAGGYLAARSSWKRQGPNGPDEDDDGARL